MLVLFETAAGFAVFKLLKEKRLKESENLYLDFENPELASKIVKLKYFQPFKDTQDALKGITGNIEGKISKPLKKLLKKLVSEDAQEQLAVADAKIGNIIKEKYSLQCVANSSINELMRCIRSQMDSLITGLKDDQMSMMARGLAHSLSRYKLKFSPDKVDTMIVQAIALLDDLDKEINNYIMRAREWYGWHFPELSKIVQDNLAYARTVLKIGDIKNVPQCDLSDILPEEVEAAVKSAAEISMGTEISEEDVENISYLCEEVVKITEYRTLLYDYLKSRMVAVAPNLTTLVGELVGARLIAHAGSLVNLAKHPSSTVQILGAEKALFRALKAKHDTPKYGLIYHASLVGQATPKNKGKMSRMLAAKASLAARVDALAEDADATLGLEQRVKLERRIRDLENRGAVKISGSGKKQAKVEKYENKSEVRVYNPAADSTLPSVPKKRKAEDDEDVKTPKKIKVEIKVEHDPDAEPTAGSEKKKKKKRRQEEETEEKEISEGSALEGSEKKKKKKKKRADSD